ncbi:MAG: DUF4288 domain-containing protein [Chitinophagaceae bacterium]|nr:DUF4288 domain-containing protein [Chitinophagaceae bacterium]
MSLKKNELCSNAFPYGAKQEKAQNWYLVKLVFQIICGNGNHTPQFDEQLRLIAANNSRRAIEKAKQLAADETHINDFVQWKFIAVTDVYPFNKLLDGAELFSRVTEEEQEAAYLHTLQLKANDTLQHLLITQ